MSRVQLALNVEDLDVAILFYSKLFGVAPAKVKPGYANFAIAEPPLKLVLIEVPSSERGTGVAGAPTAGSPRSWPPPGPPWRRRRRSWGLFEGFARIGAPDLVDETTGD